MRYPIFGIGQKGKSPNVTAQNRLNLYMDVQAQEDKTQISLHPTMGTTLLSNFGDTPARGMFSVDNFMYIVHLGTFWEVTAAGVKTNRGTLTTNSGRVDMATNHAGIIAVQDGTKGYFYTIATTTFATITDAQHIQTAATVAYHDGFFIYPKPSTGQFFLSTADATDVADMMDALDFATAEKAPDNLVRVFDNNTEILLCGGRTVEFWNNTGSADFPYSRVTGGVIELGLASKWAIARFAESSTMMLAVNSVQGDVKVIRIDGFNYVTVSNPDIDTIFNGYTATDASAFSYTKEGHPFFQLNFPTDGKSWLYDGMTNLWSELSYGSQGARHRGEMGTNFLNKFYISDYENGNVYQLASGVYSDNGEPIVREVTGRHIFDEKFVGISRLWVDMEPGVGLNSGQGTDPQMSLKISRDGGHSWGVEKLSPLGKIGQYLQRTVFRRLGRSYDWIFKLRTSAPVKTVFAGAWVSTAG